jgi:mono/diheme cytochrome c family protein
MSTIRIAALVLAIALALFMIFPNLSWAADDGPSLYKAKCTACHAWRAGKSPRATLSGVVVSQRINR